MGENPHWVRTKWETSAYGCLICNWLQYFEIYRRNKTSKRRRGEPRRKHRRRVHNAVIYVFPFAQQRDSGIRRYNNAKCSRRTAEDKVGGNTRPAHPHLRLVYLLYPLVMRVFCVYTTHSNRWLHSRAVEPKIVGHCAGRNALFQLYTL